jgi:hypothetical protein
MVGQPNKAKKYRQGLSTAGTVLQVLSPVVGTVGSALMGPAGGLIGAGLGGVRSILKYFGNQELDSDTPVESPFFYNGI